MLPLQSTFSLVTPEHRRGAVFGLGGALSVTAAGGSYLVAGWLSELTNPASAVTMCAVICLGATVLLAARWPAGRARHGGLAGLRDLAARTPPGRTRDVRPGHITVFRPNIGNRSRRTRPPD